MTASHDAKVAAHEAAASAPRERITLFDTTLRDGAQTPGIDFSVEDKIVVADMLDALGLDYIEGGYPGANPTDTAFFEKPRTKRPPSPPSA